jgi:GTPase
MPYTVVGSAIVRCGVLSFGVVGPNTAMLLGQYTRFNFPSRASSSTMKRLSMFSFHAKAGSFSAVALSKAASR